LAKRANERDEVDDDVDEEYEEYEDENEDDYDDDEQEDEQEDDDEELDPRTQKAFNAYREEWEKKVIDQLSSGDTNSPIYKGMQKVVSKKDQELRDARSALTSLAQEIDKVNSINETNVEATKVAFEVLNDLLDDDGKAALANRLQQRGNELKSKQLEKRVEALGNQRQQQGQGAQQQGDEDAFKEYRKKATQTLKNLAKRAGVDPESRDLEYGDEQEPLVDRMEKFEKSLDKALEKGQDENIRKVRQKITPPRTRNGTEGGPQRRAQTGNDLMSAAAADLVAQMRKLM
jgi:hypothetical protein